MEFTCNKVLAVFKDESSSFVNGVKPLTQFRSKDLVFDLLIKNDKIYISITSDNDYKPEELHLNLMSLIKLIAIVKGRFLKLRHLKFFSHTHNNSLLQKAIKLKKNQLDMYTHNKMFNTLFSFNIDLLNNLDVLFQRWQDLDNKLSLQNTIFFYSTADISFPSDLRLALLTQCFEPIYELLVKENRLTKEPTSRSSFKSKIQSLIENDSSISWPKKFKKNDYIAKVKNITDDFFGKEVSFSEKMTAIIESYGCNLFLKNLEVNPEYVDEIANNRNMVFHVNIKENKKCPSKNEKIRLIWKFSILYRLVVMSLLNKPYDPNNTNFNYLISAINTWPARHPSLIEWLLSKGIK